MHTISQKLFSSIIATARVSSRLKKELKFVASVAELSTDWSNYEIVAISNREKSTGVLLLQPNNDFYLAPYEMIHRIIDSGTGRNRAVICDFCYTWQPGSNAASITFTNPNTKAKIRFLCCGDLACSQHVRTATKASLVSRTQLRENLTNDERITRLKLRLTEKITDLELPPIDPTLFVTDAK